VFTPHPSGTNASDPYCWSSGPWLPDRFYCPARSSLTMATSAPLSTACRLMDYSVRLLTCAHRGSPIYSASPSDHAVARTPVAPTTAFDDAFAAGIAFAPLSRARQPQFPHQSGSNGVALSKLQHSLYATAWSFARPAPVRTFTTELAWAGSPLVAQVGYI